MTYWNHVHQGRAKRGQHSDLVMIQMETLTLRVGSLISFIGVHYAFSRRATSFHRWAKCFELSSLSSRNSVVKPRGKIILTTGLFFQCPALKNPLILNIWLESETTTFSTEIYKKQRIILVSFTDMYTSPNCKQKCRLYNIKLADQNFRLKKKQFIDVVSL